VRYASAQKAEIDIHHLTAEQAKRHLELYLSRADGSVKEVTVIHGYSGGTVLRDMVRNSLRHPRIRSKYASLNPGVTILVLS
jgi:DNA-nicking Smr family endonuclease